METTNLRNDIIARAKGAPAGFRERAGVLVNEQIPSKLNYRDVYLTQDEVDQLVEVFKHLDCLNLDNLMNYNLTHRDTPVIVSEPSSSIEWERTRIEGANWVLRTSLFTYEFKKWKSNVDAILDKKNTFTIEWRRENDRS